MPASDPRPPSLPYWDYIRVPDLLSLQGGMEGDESRLSSEEVVFITVHQVYELWFKLALQDLQAARDLFKQSPVPDDALAGACRRLDRLVVILRLCADHFPLIETLTTRDYLEFRDKLFPANGGQSPQFRELELLLGLEDAARLPYVGGDGYDELLRGPQGAPSWALERVQRRRQDRPTFKAALEDWLLRTPIQASSPGDPGDDAVVDRFVRSYLAAHRAALQETAEQTASTMAGEAERATLRQRYAREMEHTERFLNAADAPPEQRARRRRIRAAALFIEIYRELPLLAWPREVLDKVVAMEQAFVIYRQRHARMAERVIGRRVGTGGSAGVDYLDAVALKYRVFEDLWAARTALVRRDRLPDVERPEFYGFRFEGRTSPGAQFPR